MVFDLADIFLKVVIPDLFDGDGWPADALTAVRILHDPVILLEMYFHLDNLADSCFIRYRTEHTFCSPVSTCKTHCGRGFQSINLSKFASRLTQ